MVALWTDYHRLECSIILGPCGWRREGNYPWYYSNQTREVLHHCLSTPQFIRRILIDFDGAAGLDKLLGRGTGGCKISQGQVKKNALKKKTGEGKLPKKKLHIQQKRTFKDKILLKETNKTSTPIPELRRLQETAKKS